MELDKIKLNPNNPRFIKDDNFKKLVKSLIELPVMTELREIVVDEDNVIIGGNMRYRAAKEAGWKEIPTKVFTRAMADENNKLTNQTKTYAEYCKEIMVKDNISGGEWDWELLSSQFEKEELEDWGLDIENKEAWDTDEVKEDVAPLVELGDAISQYGDVYQIGNGRLMCGDSTKNEDVGKLMGGVQADMVFTDPPYNVNYSGKGKNTSETILNDNMTQEEFQKFLDDCFIRLNENCKNGSVWYVCHSQKNASIFEKSIKNSGYEIKEQIIWVKPSATLGWQDYRRQHEPLFYCGKENTTFYGDRTNTTVWQQKPNKKSLIQWLQNQISKDYDGTTTIWKIGRTDVNEYTHTTEKPVALSARAIKNSSKQGDIVLDVFAGSGSTMSACLQGNRVPYLMELDPHYCDVIRKRYAKFINSEDWESATPKIL